MCDVRKSVVRLVALGLAAGLLSAAAFTAKAQVGGQVTVNKKKTQQGTPRRETNASRQARIRRTIEDTYSHRYEIFGGGGFLRFRSGSVTQRNNEVSWASSGQYFFNPKLYAIAEAQGSFGNAKPTRFNGFSQSYNPQINEYFFTGGAGYRFYRREKISLSGQVQGGLGWGIFSGGAKGIPSTELGMWQDGFRPAVTVGLNVEYNFYPNLAFRITPTWVGTTFVAAPGTPGSSLQSDVGFNAGIVYRFGRQK